MNARAWLIDVAVLVVVAIGVLAGRLAVDGEGQRDRSAEPLALGLADLDEGPSWADVLASDNTAAASPLTLVTTAPTDSTSWFGQGVSPVASSLRLTVYTPPPSGCGFVDSGYTPLLIACDPGHHPRAVGWEGEYLLVECCHGEHDERCPQERGQ